jgi:hypothetical protein
MNNFLSHPWPDTKEFARRLLRRSLDSQHHAEQKAHDDAFFDHVLIPRGPHPTTTHSRTTTTGDERPKGQRLTRSKYHPICACGCAAAQCGKALPRPVQNSFLKKCYERPTN